MKRLLFALFAVAGLASCNNESSMDSTLIQGEEMTFAPYAGASVTKGTPVSTNTVFASVNKNFKVAAYSESTLYFGFNTVSYTGGAWTNTETMYWPNKSGMLHFGAYSPAGETFTTAPAYTYDATHGSSLTLGYAVNDNVAEQKDLMYAISDYNYTVSTTDVDPASVGMHFKHALTQVRFTATRATDIKVTVKSIQLCNVKSGGDFAATAATNKNGSTDITTDQGPSAVISSNAGSWPTLSTTYKHYAGIMDGSADVVVNTTTTDLTDDGDAMMLIPQTLKAWDPEVKANNTGGESFLAINCVITHDDGKAPIVDGFIFVPISTKDIPYVGGNFDGWKPGYKVTYNLHFGGGYTYPGEPTPTIPTPGETPDPEDVIPTLRAIKYTVTVDDWVPVAGAPVTVK